MDGWMDDLLIWGWSDIWRYHRPHCIQSAGHQGTDRSLRPERAGSPLSLDTATQWRCQSGLMSWTSSAT